MRRQFRAPGLARRTPLKARSEPRTPKAKERAKARVDAYDAVWWRARGKCELCEYPWRRATGEELHPHHVFMRGHVADVPTKYCDTPEFVMGICGAWPATGYRGCHERIHDPKTAEDRALAAQAEGLAVLRFARLYELERELTELIDQDWRPLDIARELIRIHEARVPEEEQTA